ncbi:hypothetical protein LOK49_LG04G00414 [Camellia lanceoleosa]|uniref:Uncharacterized protein n=1 Tax=Camellia lanceoleosa TaxID=1840588 RepID=A0ACC0I4N1_9ERIC|nr:hypothetical protein LOK49_LG04G00414 [Camellia lanceoleosa]
MLMGINGYGYGYVHESLSPFRSSQLIGQCMLLLFGFRQPHYIVLLPVLLSRPSVITDYWPVTTLNL